jgi:hypothetical protein
VDPGLGLALTLSLPAPNPLTAERESNLSEMLSKIYQYCRGHRHQTLGQPGMTWRMELEERNFTVCPSPGAPAEKLRAFTFTPYVDARKEVVGSHFEFRLPRGAETYFARERIGFRGLQLYISGNEFERTFPEGSFEIVTQDQWDLWGLGLTAPIYEHYERVIYPKVVETLQKMGAMKAERPLCVMDLGGGSGGLSETICRSVPAAGKVVLVDRSAVLIGQAGPRAARFPGRLVTVCADITSEGFLQAFPDSPDVIVLCGVVAQQVMTREEGLRLMRQCHRKLPAGGFALVPSYSPALLTSVDYGAMGFAVHNKTLNVIEDTPRGPELHTNDFYILERGA